MNHRLYLLIKYGIYLATAVLICSIFISCNDSHSHIGTKTIVDKVEEIDQKAEVVIQGTLKDLLQNNSELPDSLRIKNASFIKQLYEQQKFQPLWTTEGKILPPADSMIRFIDSSRYYGLFPDDYYQSRLHQIRSQLLDTSKDNKLDAAKWAHFDLLLSSGFVQLVKDLNRGRLQADSILEKDTSLNNSFFASQLNLFKEVPPDSFARALEPQHIAYDSLKTALRGFMKNANFRRFTKVQTKDSLLLPKLIYKRLSEDDSLKLAANQSPDSLELSMAIKKYQKRSGIKSDGKISQTLIDRLNNTDQEKFMRIAINMDRYKILEPLPSQYIWVNIPSFSMQVKDSDTVVLTSKVVVGKPNTRTPVLTSAVNYMVTYPRWHIPESIIKNEILPGLKKDPGYTHRKGYFLIDNDGNEIDPYSVKWSKYSKGIPYKVVQGSGDENALGVMKFNFENKYSVYLHDTNQRYLFSRSKRALSHGCVRVEAWKNLADFLVKNDSIKTGKFLPSDSLNNWLARKEKHSIPVRAKVPLYIRYFSVEVKNNKLVFHDDVYGEDRKLSDRFFDDK